MVSRKFFWFDWNGIAHDGSRHSVCSRQHGNPVDHRVRNKCTGVSVESFGSASEGRSAIFVVRIIDRSVHRRDFSCNIFYEVMMLATFSRGCSASLPVTVNGPPIEYNRKTNNR